MTSKTYGTVFVLGDHYIFDAEPHVMSKVRSILSGTSVSKEIYVGKFTHSPVSISITMNNSKDILWIANRFPLDIPSGCMDSLNRLSSEYDNITQAIAFSEADTSWNPPDSFLKLNPDIKLGNHQISFYNMQRKSKRMLLADKMGLGKTFSAASVLGNPECRPALIVVPTHVLTQWDNELHRLYPDITTHVIRKGDYDKPIPNVDAIVIAYSRVFNWVDYILKKPLKTLIMDEVHEIRHCGTNKQAACLSISQKVQNCIGLSGTPIFNYGNEIHSVIDTISPGSLGSYSEFSKEWCDWSSKIREPAVLNSYLKSLGLMLRRSPEQAGFDIGKASKNVITIDADLHALDKIRDVAKMLAISVLSGKIEESDSAKEFDVKLRHATGVAKARPVAEFCKMILSQGDKVVLAGWHRDVYDIWLNELKEYNPVMFTGSETTAQKEKAKKEFIDGNVKVFIISLRSGAGLDGLQLASSKMVFGELDWSPHVMDQVLGRLDRPGQTEHVQAFYLTISDGSDPIIMGINSKKRNQHDGLIEGKEGDVSLLETTSSPNRIREMAEGYLKSIGEGVPERVSEIGLLKDVADLLRKVKISFVDEKEMQASLFNILKANMPSVTVMREVKVGKRGRIDFVVSNETEKIGIECKINNTDRSSVYRQVRKYTQDISISSLVLFAPWSGIDSFSVDGTPVLVVDFTKNSV